MKKYFTLIFISFILLLSILFIGPKLNKYLENKKIKNISNSIVEIIKKDDLVLYQDDKGLDITIIKEKIEQNNLKGQGFFIDNKGIILTNKHIVDNKNGNYLVITESGEKYNAEVLYIDKKSDFSLIQIDTNKYKGLKLSNSKPFIGQTVYKLKNNNFIKANILKTNIKLDEDSNNIIQTTINLNSGDSGSPLFINNFYIIGINTAKSNTINNSYSTIVTKDQIEQILKKLD